MDGYLAEAERSLKRLVGVEAATRFRLPRTGYGCVHFACWPASGCVRAARTMPWVA